MRIYKVTWNVTLEFNGEDIDGASGEIKVAAETMDEALIKTKEHLAKEELDGFKETTGVDDEGEKYTQRYHNLQFDSCELIEESEI